MTEDPAAPTAPAPRQGVVFSLEGMDELAFVQVLHDVTSAAAFRRPLQIQVQEPRAGRPGALTLVFGPQDRALAAAAVQRLKTILLRHGVQIDSIRFPGEDGFSGGLSGP
ncbi:hypothetical protein [Deinococcus sp. Marseille-Q6407]|uniref:hypothetical protein n=1 Tax=Deinococcus sp. Marseille-Q6407 TaxID=2969223 RepID=UPI0021BE9593|nr:hypothetical protein [Deinococcus sp. Marseille-Q6407]